MKLLRDSLLLGGMCLVGVTAFAPPAQAHGGQYRGPEDVVPPPTPGGRGTGRPALPGGQTGGGTGPGHPGPAIPGTGATTGGRSRGGTGRQPGQTGPRGYNPTDDFTGWDYWWEFNKDPFIRLKDAVHHSGTPTGSDDFYLGSGRARQNAADSLKPTDGQIDNEILPALKRALDDTLERDFDIISSCLVAMAKIGRDHREFKLVEVFRPRLKANNQEIRETAALALGIAGITDDSEAQMQLLAGLVLDNDFGRKASEASEVNERTRSFAAYGLGLAAHSTPKVTIKRQAFEALKTLLTKESVSSRNLRVAAIHGISLLNLGSKTQAERDLMREALATLEDFYMLPLGPGDQLLQSHCPTAIAKLIGRDHPTASHYRELFAKDLQRKGAVKRSSRDIQRSCALALGQLVRRNDSESDPDHGYNLVLLDSYHNAKDAQTRYFSILALGQIGGKHNRATLLKQFDKSRSMNRPWCALSLGVFSFFEQEQADRNATIGDTLFDALRASKGPDHRAALAVALGLARHSAAGDYMTDLMLSTTSRDKLPGYLCIGLALMRHMPAKPDIRNVVRTSTRRPDLLSQAAVALGKLGDKQVADLLRDLLAEGDGNLAKLAAISSALGFIGDRRSIRPLNKMLLDPSMSQLSRAFAAVALGGIADKEPLPWNSKIAVNSNYRANTETLTNGSSGILDIL